MLQLLCVKLKICKNWQQSTGDKYRRNTNKLGTKNMEKALTRMTLKIRKKNLQDCYYKFGKKKNTNNLATKNTEKSLTRLALQIWKKH